MVKLWSRLRGSAPATAAFAAAGLLGVMGVSAPAYADEGDSPLCYLSTGSISVFAGATQVTSVPYGTNLTVTWSVDPACQDYALFMQGPGFGGTEQVYGASRGNIWATPPDGSRTLTWTLVMEGLDASVPQLMQLATKTVTVT